MNYNLGRLAALGAAGLLLGSRAQANVRLVPPAQVAAAAQAVRPMDHRFVLKAEQGGDAEISLGHVALLQSKSAAVKSFARKMIADHTAAGNKLAAIVASLGGPTLPTGLSQADAAARAALAQLSGAAFDASYLKGQVAGHQKMAALMQKEASDGANSALKEYASATLPSVRMHLALAQKRMAMLSRGE